MRDYTRKLDIDGDYHYVPIAEWLEDVKVGGFTNWDGSGYWVKDGYKSNDEVFSSDPEDATHVIWYNK